MVRQRPAVLTVLLSMVGVLQVCYCKPPSLTSTHGEILGQIIEPKVGERLDKMMG